MGKPVIITLKVEANALYNAPDTDQTNQTFIDSKCSLEDDNGGSLSNAVETFQSNVYINQNVKWQGETDDQGYAVAIVSIEHESTNTSDPDAPSNENFFDETIVNSGNIGRSANVNVNVRNDSTLAGKLDVYTINFRVYATGNNYKSYKVDPKLRGNP